MMDFFQMLYVKRFVFSDCDNVNAKDVGDFLISEGYLNFETQVICLLGANQNQNNWYTTIVKYLQKNSQAKAFNLTPIRISTEHSNAVDFVLSAYVGLAMGQNPKAEFVIIAKDGGYDSVVEHFKTIGLGISQKKFATKKVDEKKSQKKRLCSDDKEMIETIKKKIITTDKNKRPKTIEKFGRYIKSAFPKLVAKISTQLKTFTNELLDILKNEKYLTIDGNNLTWLK